MSLNDQFFPNDGSLINRFDNFMIDQAATLGGIYQKLTGRSYKELAKAFYGVANKVSKISIIPGLLIGYFVSRACDSVAKGAKFETPLEEELRYESEDLPKHFGKYTRIIPPFMGIILTAVGIAEMNDENVIYYVTSLGTTGAGSSLLTLTIAEYLSKANLPEPKRETESLAEKLKKLFPKSTQREPPVTYSILEVSN